MDLIMFPIRMMCIVQFINRSSWHLIKQVKLEDSQLKYQRGAVIKFHHKKYIVLEDHTYLRVVSFNDNINPLEPLIEQIPNR